MLIAHYTVSPTFMLALFWRAVIASEVEPLIGVFHQYGILRTDLSGDPGFFQLLHVSSRP